MTDPEPMAGEAAIQPAPPLDGPADGTAASADVGTVGTLQGSAQRATLGLAAYSVIALGLIGWSLRRGRLSDALLLLVAMAVTLPPILSYRKQLRKRLRTLAGGAVAGEPGTPAELAGETTDGSSIADAAAGQAPSPPLEA